MSEIKPSSSDNHPVMPKPNMRPGGGGPRGPVMNFEKPKNTKGTLKRLISYIGSSKYLLITLMLVMLFITLLNLAAPALQQRAIDCITLTNEKLAIDKQSFIRNLMILACTYVLSCVFSYLQGIFSARLSQTTVRKMRHDLFQKLVRLSIRYTDTHNHGDIMSRMTNDVENISNTITSSIGSLLSGFLSVIGAIAIMLYYSPLMTLVSFSTIFLTILTSYFMSKYMRKFFKQQQTILGEINGHIEEMVTGYKTVVAFGRQNKSKETFNTISGRLKQTSIKAQILGGSMGPMMNIISNIGFLLIAIVGGSLAFKGAITVGTIQAFILYSKQLSRPINEIANQYAQIQTSIAGAERVFSVMDAQTETDTGNASLNAENIQGEILFKNVNFGYRENEPVLKNFNLEVKSGQKIAIVGATGSGKTTVVNLLTRFYDIDSGLISIDGTDIRNIPKDDLRKNIAIVLQDTVLFNETISTNIKYGNLTATDEQMFQAAQTANANRFIERLPDGYSTVLSEGGSNLSQGQRQLLSMARAVLADPKILILDEATSSVDTRTEMKIQSAMLALMKNRTSLIIAHRLSTIRDADKIIVIDNGSVVEEGNHEDLLEQKGCYYRLYQNQFAGIET